MEAQWWKELKGFNRFHFQAWIFGCQGSNWAAGIFFISSVLTFFSEFLGKKDYIFEKYKSKSFIPFRFNHLYVLVRTPNSISKSFLILLHIIHNVKRKHFCAQTFACSWKRKQLTTIQAIAGYASMCAKGINPFLLTRK